MQKHKRYPFAPDKTMINREYNNIITTKFGSFGISLRATPSET